MPDAGDLTAFLAMVTSDADQESTTHDPEDCADWRNSCSAHNAMRLAGMAREAMDLAGDWDAKAKEIGSQIRLEDCDGAVAGFKMIGYQTHHGHAVALREALAATLTGAERTHDERCCMTGNPPGLGPHPDCPGYPYWPDEERGAAMSTNDLAATLAGEEA